MCLPNVFLIGASKAGTTSLVDYLANTTGVHFVQRGIHKFDKHNEIHRFDRSSYSGNWKSIELYHEWASSPVVPSVHEIVVHYTPHYLYAPTVPFEIATFYPSNKEMYFISLLRDPVERMVSSYWFKNSHLFQGTDRGSAENFELVYSSQVKKRADFEFCVGKGISEFLKIHQKPAMVPEFCSSAEKASRGITCRYIRVTLLLLDLFFECHGVNDHHGNWAENNRTASPFLTFRCQRRTRSPGLSTGREALRRSLEHCFGDRLRHRSLGWDHLDKSIYFDQLVRWLMNFPHPADFLFVRSEEFFARPRETVARLLTEHLRPRFPHSTASPNLANWSSEVKRLHRPNALAVDQQLSTQQIAKLREFFSLYNRALFSLLS